MEGGNTDDPTKKEGTQTKYTQRRLGKVETHEETADTTGKVTLKHAHTQQAWRTNKGDLNTSILKVKDRPHNAVNKNRHKGIEENLNHDETQLKPKWWSTPELNICSLSWERRKNYKKKSKRWVADPDPDTEQKLDLIDTLNYWICSFCLISASFCRAMNNNMNEWIYIKRILQAYKCTLGWMWPTGLEFDTYPLDTELQKTTFLLWPAGSASHRLKYTT